MSTRGAHIRKFSSREHTGNWPYFPGSIPGIIKKPERIKCRAFPGTSHAIQPHGSCWLAIHTISRHEAASRHDSCKSRFLWVKCIWFSLFQFLVLLIWPRVPNLLLFPESFPGNFTSLSTSTSNVYQAWKNLPVVFVDILSRITPLSQSILGYHICAVWKIEIRPEKI